MAGFNRPLLFHGRPNLGPHSRPVKLPQATALANCLALRIVFKNFVAADVSRRKLRVLEIIWRELLDFVGGS